MKATKQWISIVTVFTMISLAFLFLNVGHSEAWSGLSWSKAYGGPGDDRAKYIQPTIDGGYIVAGHTDSFGQGQTDGLVIKLKEDGEIEWKKTYGGSSFDYINSIKQTDDHGYIVAGSSDFNLWILKLDQSGGVAWQKIYDNVGRSDWAEAIQRRPGGGYIVAGNSMSLSGGFSSNIWVLKLSSDGSIESQKLYESEHDVKVKSIRPVVGGYLLAGSIEPPFSDNREVLILKLKDNLEIDEILPNEPWESLYAASGFEEAIDAWTVPNGYIVAGTTNSSGEGRVDGMLLKLNNDASIAWQKTFGGVDIDAISSMVRTTDGYIVAGSSLSFGVGGGRDLWLVKFDANGTIVWEHTYGDRGIDYATSIWEENNGYYIVAGYTASFGAGDNDIWVMRIDNRGRNYCVTTKPLGIFTRCLAADCKWGGSYAVQGDGILYWAEETGMTPVDTNAIIGTATFTENDPALVTTNGCKPYKIILKPEYAYLPYFRTSRSPWHMFSMDRRDKFSQKRREKKGPHPIVKLRHETARILKKDEGYDISYKESVKQIVSLLKRVPIGSYYSQEMKKDLLDQLSDSKEFTPKVLDKLARAINALELDSSAPAISSQEVKVGKEDIVSFPGAAWLTFKHIKKPGKASLVIRDDLPAFFEKNLMPGWPIASYDFDFTGELDKDGYIEVKIYFGGIDFTGDLSDLLMFEWEGEGYKNITTNIDLQKKVITGITGKLSTYVVMSPIVERKVKCSE